MYAKSTRPSAKRKVQKDRSAKRDDQIARPSFYFFSSSPIPHEITYQVKTVGDWKKGTKERPKGI